MPVDGQVAVEIEEFGGLNTQRDSSNLPPYMSPACYNVEFIPRTVKSRHGFTTVLNGSGLATSINYIKSYIMPNGDIRTLYSDDVGGFWYEDATSNPDEGVQVDDNGFLPDSFPNSVTMFGKEFIAFGDGRQGYDIPRKYDGTTMSRISQDGPGAAPQASEEVVSIDLLNSPNGAQPLSASLPNLNLSESSNVVTAVNTLGGVITILGANDAWLKVGDKVRIAASPVSGYNGDQIVTGVTYAANGIDVLSFNYITPFSSLATDTSGLATFKIAVYDFLTAIVAPYEVGQLVEVSDVVVTAYNGTWKIRGTTGVSGQSFFVYIEDEFTLAASGGSGAPVATIAAAGNIDAGKHLVAVMFGTSDGYITRPSPTASWIATGGRRVIVGDIPIGPDNVIRRYVIFTPAESEDFFYIPTESEDPDNDVFSTVIEDNTTTTATFDFSDERLLSGVPANDFFDLITLPPVNGFVEYKSRLIAIGALNLINNLLNISFDGGWTPGLPYPLGTGTPLGWVRDETDGGQMSRYPSGIGTLPGDAAAIQGDGIGTVFGKMTQSAYKDSFGVPILQPGTAYTVAAYFSKTADLVGVTYTIRLSSVSESFSTEMVIDAENDVVEGEWVRITGELDEIPTPVPSDLTLTVFAENSITGEWLIVDELQFYPTNNPVQNSLAMVSLASDPESFDGLTGLLQPAEENGQALTSAFVIRDFLYLVKERSLFVTQDNGSEPSGDDPWQIDEVSQRVGTYSFRGVGIGDEWAIIAGETGCWYFTGGIITEDAKLSNEVQPTWDRTNWEFGWMVDVKVDTKRKRFYVALPLDSAEQPSNIAVLDYTQGFTDATDNQGVGRKWTLWNVGINSHNMVVRPDGTLAYYIGVNTGNQVKKHDITTRNDGGDAIDNLYQTGYFEGETRSNWGYLRANVQGAGTLNLTLKRAPQWTRQIRGWLMNLRGFFDMERMIQAQGNRLSISFGTNDADSYWDMQGLKLSTTEAIYAPVRGTNQT